MQGIYRITPVIGRARHVVTFYPRGLYNDDGSPRPEIRICGNKRELVRRVRMLESQGYVKA